MDSSDPFYKESWEESSKSHQRQLVASSDPFYRSCVSKLQECQQNAVCGRACVRQDLNNPPTAVGGIFRSTLLACPYRKDLNYPPTAVGGIWTFGANLFPTNAKTVSSP